MSNIKAVNIIKKQYIESNNYLKTLIEEAYNNKLLTDAEVTDLYVQMYKLLDEVVYKYNGIDSTSIKKQDLETISESCFYTINVYLKTIENPDVALKMIKEKGIQEVYEIGKKKIYRMLDIVRIMYIRVKRNMLNINNETYNDTIIEGIKGFLKIYDADFNAQDMKITADYPLYNSLIGKVEGVEFIKDYLNSIYLENQFCKNFSEKKIKYLLYAYSPQYKDLIINIFEIVFLEVIACKLVKRDIQDLSISRAELEKIYEMFNNKKEEEIYRAIEKAYQEIRKEIIIDNNDLHKYIEQNMSYVKKLIKNSLEQKVLDKIFIEQKFIDSNV